MLRLYLAFKPVSSPTPKALFRAENVELVHATCFPHNSFPSYDFSANLASHIRIPSEEMVLSGIKLFLKARGRMLYDRKD